MKYMGSKNRLAKHILPIMLKYRKPNQTWIEPFVGGGNLIQHVSGPRIGSDSNPWVIQALKLIRDNPESLPKNNSEFTKEDYLSLRKDDSNPLKGFAGFAYSFGGKWLDSWAQNKKGSDYVKEAYNSAQKQSPKLQEVVLVCCDYKDLPLHQNSLIYCDPPYKGTTKYKTKNSFDHEAFYDWCIEKDLEGHTVFVSEYSMPEPFVEVWSKEVNSSLSNGNQDTRIEKLFMLP